MIENAYLRAIDSKGFLSLMNKEELTKAVAREVDLTQDKIGKVIDAVLKEIIKALKKGDNVRFIGFGTFTVSKIAPRSGRNPRTGVPIEISARSVARFKPGKILKSTLKHQ